MTFQLGVDIGGTFTDFALFNAKTEEVAVYKQLTTPEDPSIAVLDGIKFLLGRHRVNLKEVSTIVHGTTLVTNAVIERKGAVTGMLTTAGFRDLLDIAKERRYDLFDLRLVFPKPLIPRLMRYEIQERILYDGSLLQALDMQDVATQVQELLARFSIQSLAICLLHSYINPTHELKIKEWINKHFPKIYVSCSAEVFPFMREYERFTTATVNAYVQPIVDSYLKNIEEGLQQGGFIGNLYIMSSSGGTVTPETARRFPVRMLESGPAAGVLMSASLGKTLNLPNLLSFDMGGTTAKGALIRDGVPRKNYEMEVARVHDFKQGSGLPIKTPVIDMIEIGAGGGSIVEVDERKLIRVGPKSAGAHPGPACYGHKGIHATLTDADLVLGYLDPEFFVGGRMKLDRIAAETAIQEWVGKPLGLTGVKSAWGIHEVINEDVARAFRIHASERGVDYRNCSMIAFGGSGPIHAVRVARKLKIPRVIFPLGAGVMSAFGLLTSPLSFDVVRSHRIDLGKLGLQEILQQFQPMIREALDLLRKSGVRTEDVCIERKLDMRYQGQGFEIEILIPGAKEIENRFDQIRELFNKQYENIFTISMVDEPLEIINWKVGATGPKPHFEVKFAAVKDIASDRVLKGKRPAYFPEPDRYIDCPVYDRYGLPPRMVISGPALIEENESTCVIGFSDVACVDANYNLVVDLKSKGERE
jgi:N-methylhydantoinase A